MEKEPARETYGQLQQVIETLPTPPATYKRWAEVRRRMIQRFGNDSIYSLLPETPPKLRFIRVLFLLPRGGIFTKSDLAACSLEKLSYVSGIGPKSMKLIEAMRNVAIAELAENSQTSNS